MSDRPIKRKVEFIESYWTGGELGSDYQWSDNHGELIRCNRCTFYRPGNRFECCLHEEHTEKENYCSWAVKKKDV